MSAMSSQIIRVSTVSFTVCSGANKRRHQSSASLAFVRGIHQCPWIPCSKGQWRGKCLHLMTSSWPNGMINAFVNHEGATIGKVTVYCIFRELNIAFRYGPLDLILSRQLLWVYGVMLDLWGHGVFGVFSQRKARTIFTKQEDISALNLVSLDAGILGAWTIALHLNLTGASVSMAISGQSGNSKSIVHGFEIFIYLMVRRLAA